MLFPESPRPSPGCTLTSGDCCPLDGSPLLLKQQQNVHVAVANSCMGGGLINTLKPTQQAHKQPGCHVVGRSSGCDWFQATLCAVNVTCQVYHVFVHPVVVYLYSFILKGRSVGLFQTIAFIARWKWPAWCVCVRVQADEAFVTLATNDNYAKGAMVLGQSLRKHNTTRKLVALVGPHVAEPCR